MVISERNSCNKYVGKNHKCYLKKVKAKGGYCMAGNKNPCKNNDSIKKEGLVPFIWNLHREIHILRLRSYPKYRYPHR